MRSVLKTKSASARIARAMGIFSGVKVINILCSLARNKAIAWFVGPAGMGLVVLFNSILDLISQTSRLSIDQSVQRDISQCAECNAGTTITVVRRWALWLGLAGSVITCAMSPLLSLWSFDTFSHWPVFCLLSLVPVCLTYSVCTTAQNQGLRRFKAVALSNIVGSVAGLVLAIPLIIWLRIDSIAWVVLVYGITAFAGAYAFRPRIKNVKLSHNEIVLRGRSFIRLGSQITLATFVTQAFNYLFVLVLNTYASTDTLGLYQSGYTLMNSYVGIIFMAMLVEYYPRLSATAHSPRRLTIAVSHQARLTLTVMTPLLCLLIVLINPVIRLIYSDTFLAVIPYVVAGCVGVVLRATSWCMAYVILARGDGKAYLTTEITSAAIGFALNVAGYFFGGLLGLGIAYIIWFGMYTAIVCIICKRRYDVTFSPKAMWLSLLCFALTSATAVVYLLTAWN